MDIHNLKSFRKAFKKQPVKIQVRFFVALEKLINDPTDPQLHNHNLKGELTGLKSFNVTGDVRVHYRKDNNNLILVNIGTHSELYN